MELSVSSILFPIVSSAVIYGGIHLLVGGALFFVRRRQRTRFKEQDVSVLVAAHNEEASISDTLSALSDQSVAPSEIVVIDDRSTDRTSDIVSSEIRKNTRIHLVQIDTTPPGVSPKKHALTQGIRSSTGRLLLFTDADCAPPHRWIESMIDAFDEDTGVVIGANRPAFQYEQRGFLGATLRAFIRFEKLRSGALSWGATQLGFPWTASGTSFAYRREVFDEIGGYQSHETSLSGDDDLFLHDVRKKTAWKTGLAISEHATVATRVPETFKGFLIQRKRHFSAGKHYRWTAQLLLGVYHLSGLLSLCALPLYAITGVSEFLAAYIFRVSSDGILLFAGMKHQGSVRGWILFPAWEILYALYTIGVGSLGLLGAVSWDSRKQP